MKMVRVRARAVIALTIFPVHWRSAAASTTAFVAPSSSSSPPPSPPTTTRNHLLTLPRSPPKAPTLVVAARALDERLADAQREALDATRTYGPTSREARVAWEIAEEVEDSIYSPCSKRCDILPPRQSAETKGGGDGADDDSAAPALFVDDTIATRTSNGGSKESPAGEMSLAEAIGRAKRASDESGSDSPEALAAWDVVESLGSARVTKTADGGEA